MLVPTNKKWSIAKSFFESLLLKACSAISIIVVTMLISNRYSVESAGELFYFITLVNVISIASLLGLNHTAIKYVTKYSNDSNSDNKLSKFKFLLLYKSLKYTLCASIITALISYSIGYSFWMELTIGLALNAFLLLYSSICQGENRLIRTVLYSGLITNIVFSVVILFSGFENIKLQIQYNLVLFISLIVTVFSYRVKLYRLDKDTISRFTLEIKRMQVNSFESTLLNQAYLWSPLIIAGIYFESRDIALFSVANRIGLSISFVISFVLLVQTQRFVTNKNNIQQLKLDYKYALLISYFCSFIIVFMVYLYSPQVLGWFGSTYMFASDILFLMCCTQLLQVFNGITIALLRMCEYEVHVKKIFLLSTALLVLGTFIASYYSSIIAVAATILLSTIVQSCLLVSTVSYFWREVKSET